MWMMGYNEGVEFSLPETFNGRKLRPLMPRPATAASTYNGRTPGTSCLSHIHGADLLALNHHMAAMADQQSKREFNSQQVIVSSRWNPTPEQLQTLEELYRRGTRTPSTEEIQQITAQLRRFGKIEGKNVFYWFQNHKARERQKRRRQLESPPEEEVQQFFCDNNHDIEKKETGANGTDFEAEQRQTKNWAPPINCSTLAEGAAKAAIISECRAADGWKQVEDEELQNPRPMAERNATWQMMQLCYSPHSNNHTTSTAADITPSTTTVVKTVDPKFKKPQEVNIFLAQPEPESDYHLNHFFSVGGDLYRAAADHEEEGYEKSQTLVLFPLRSGEDGKENGEEEETQTPSQFFEFLPVKN